MKSDPYMQCYWSGREDEFDGEIGLDKLADQVAGGQGFIRVISERAAKLAIDKDMSDPASKIDWLKSNADEIKEMGGDTEKAWRLFTQGRVDALASVIEVDIMTMIEDTDEEDDEDEDEEEEPDESDEDEDPSDPDPDDEPEPAPLPVARTRARPRK